MQDNCFELITYGDLRKDCNEYKQLGHNKKLPKKLHSIVSPLLFVEHGSTLVIIIDNQ